MANKGKYTARRSSAVLRPGNYLVEVISCTIVIANNDLQTPQHATKVKNLDSENPGMITIFTNERGYVKDSKGNVEFNDDGTPKISEANTQAALEIFGNLAACAGVEGNFDLPDLVGGQLGITVIDNAGSSRVKKVMPYEDMVQLLELENIEV